MKIFALTAENFKMDGGACFGVVPKSIWQKFIPVDERNLINLTTRCLLVEDNERIVLIDTGIGKKQDEKFLSFQHIFGNNDLVSRINDLGYSTDEITDVLLTHLHYDHCGGCVSKDFEGNLELVFKNATYHCSKIQWDWAVASNPREKASYFPENFLPLENFGKLNLIRHESNISKNIQLKIFNGHTPGQIIPFIKYGKNTVVFTADFIPSAAHIPLIYIPSFDLQPLITISEKTQFLKEAVEKNYFLFFEHDFDVECCTVQSTDKGYKMKESFSLDQLNK